MWRTSCLALALLLVAVLGGPAPAAAVSECGWLAASELDRLFPQGAPWRVTVGGTVGSCQFLSRPDQPPNVFSANQMVQPSEEAAAETVAGLRTESEKATRTRDLPALGEGAFAYTTAGADEVRPRAMSFVARRGRVVVLALVSLQSGVGDEHLEPVQELIRAALAVADEPETLAAAADCPWFDAAVLPRLLPAGGVRQQTFGENSCMAQDDANAVLLVSVLPASPALMERRDGDCTWEELAGLGPNATLSHSCSGGNPRATVQMLVGDRMVQYNLAPGSEPTEEQRRALVDLATAVRERSTR